MGKKTNPSRTQPKSFFKVMFGDFVDRLRFPPAFSMDVRNGAFPKESVLKTRDGKIDRVSVIKVNDDLFFKLGWSDFVHVKSIELGDFLVFNHVGDLVFDVLIYKRRTGCEEEMISTMKKKKKNEPDCTSDEIVHIDDKNPKDGNDHDAVPIKEVAKSGGGIEAADEYKPKRPFFKVAMTFSYINRCYMHIPSKFAKKHIRTKAHFMELKVSKNKSWNVKTSGALPTGAIRLSTGWAVFVKENSLKEGDVLVFEATKKTGSAMKVSIFRS